MQIGSATDVESKDHSKIKGAAKCHRTRYGWAGQIKDNKSCTSLEPFRVFFPVALWVMPNNEVSRKNAKYHRRKEKTGVLLYCSHEANLSLDAQGYVLVQPHCCQREMSPAICAILSQCSGSDRNSSLTPTSVLLTWSAGCTDTAPGVCCAGVTEQNSMSNCMGVRLVCEGYEVMVCANQ